MLGCIQQRLGVARLLGGTLSNKLPQLPVARLLMFTLRKSTMRTTEARKPGGPTGMVG